MVLSVYRNPEIKRPPITPIYVVYLYIFILDNFASTVMVFGCSLFHHSNQHTVAEGLEPPA